MVGAGLVVGLCRTSCAWIEDATGEFSVHETIPSPSGRFKAVIFSVDCGVPCSFENAVLVTESGRDPDPDKGVVFTSSPPPEGDAVQSGDGYPLWTQVKWLSDTDLEVAYERGAEVDQRLTEVKVGGVFFREANTIRVHYALVSAPRQSTGLSGSSSRR